MAADRSELHVNDDKKGGIDKMTGAREQCWNVLRQRRRRVFGFIPGEGSHPARLHEENVIKTAGFISHRSMNRAWSTGQLHARTLPIHHHVRTGYPTCGAGIAAASMDSYPLSHHLDG